MPATVWVCTTHLASWRAAWTAEWMTKPAGLMVCSVSWMMLPSRSTLTRLDAVICENSTP